VALDAMLEACQVGKVASRVITGLEAPGGVAARDEAGRGAKIGRWSSSAGEQRRGSRTVEMKKRSGDFSLYSGTGLGLVERQTILSIRVYSGTHSANPAGTRTGAQVVSRMSTPRWRRWPGKAGA
jgi:hypothetical protein